MGLFLSIAGILGKSQEEVAASMKKYAQSTGGGFEKANLGADDDNFCVVAGANNNASFLYPNWLLDWDEISQYLSQDLNAPVFSFHIHDGDLWMYVLYVNGEIEDRFNPIPEYWDDNVDEAERKMWKGDADTVVKYAPHLKVSDIDRYLIHWDLDMENEKAYPDDHAVNEDWQLLDFIRKLRLPYPLTDDREPVGQVFNWSSKPGEGSATYPQAKNGDNKPWWKFW